MSGGEGALRNELGFRLWRLRVVGLISRGSRQVWCQRFRLVAARYFWLPLFRPQLARIVFESCPVLKRGDFPTWLDTPATFIFSERVTSPAT